MTNDKSLSQVAYGPVDSYTQKKGKRYFNFLIRLLLFLVCVFYAISEALTDLNKIY